MNVESNDALHPPKYHDNKSFSSSVGVNVKPFVSSYVYVYVDVPQTLPSNSFTTETVPASFVSPGVNVKK